MREKEREICTFTNRKHPVILYEAGRRGVLKSRIILYIDKNDRHEIVLRRVYFSKIWHGNVVFSEDFSGRLSLRFVSTEQCCITVVSEITVVSRYKTRR